MITATGPIKLNGKPIVGLRAQTREEWLRALSDKLAPTFAEAGKPLPVLMRISVGWPCKKALAGSKGRILGQCFPVSCSADKHIEIFVSPCIGKALDAAGVLAHELCHAALPANAGHKKPFIQLGEAIGLEGNPREMLPGAALRAKLSKLINEVGPFPHATLDLTKMPKKSSRKRWIKITCPGCEWAGKTTQMHIDAGLPTCHCGEQMEAADQDDGDEGEDD